MRQALAILLVIALPGVAVAEPPPAAHWERVGCEHGHPSKDAYEKVKRLVRHYRPSVRRERVQHFVRCVATRAKAHEAHVRARAWWQWRHDEPQRYRIGFNRYAHLHEHLASIAWCESKNDPEAIGGRGRFRGKYQFTFGTWGVVGGSGDPADAHEWEQDFRAALLLSGYGAGHWPVCG